MSQGNDDNFSVILWQLQQYQHIIRKWDRHLSAYQFKAVMQILDRTIGWQQEKATFRPHVMLNGDRMYSGFGRTMSRSKLMEVLSELEVRGVINREHDPYRPGLKMYSINLEWEPDDVIPIHRERRVASSNDISQEENAVPTMDTHALDGDPRDLIADNDVLSMDPVETYPDNTIVEDYQTKIIGADPSPTASDQRVIEHLEKKKMEPLARQTDAPARSMVNPPPRRRPSSK